MAARILLCIGCDGYEHMETLYGAQSDATDIRDALVAGELSCIAQEDAYLLLNPAKGRVEQVLLELQDKYEEIQSFTIYFAGHGEAANDSYFLCLQDTRSDRLSTTGFALSRLFEFFNELKAAHCNVIIDSCSAASMVSNLNVLLKPEVIGKSKTFGVSFFVSSASNQYAFEDDRGGYATAALLEVLHGKLDTGSRAKFLDLVDIGRPAALQVSEQTGGEQMPSVWGVNLYGHMPLYGNPHASDTHATSLLGLTGITPTSPAGQAISENSSALYGLLFAQDQDLGPDKLLPVLSEFMTRLESFPDAPAIFIEGIWHSLEKGSRRSKNSYALVELSATCIALLLESSRKDSNSAACISVLAQRLIVESERLLLEITECLRLNERALCRHDIPDLFYLPQRICRILGWSGAALHFAQVLGADQSAIRNYLEQISGYLTTHYASVLAGMSEEEAPYWAVFLKVISGDEMNGLGKLVVTKLISSLISCGGGLARPLLEPSQVYSYLSIRAKENAEELRKLSSSPSETLALVMLTCSKFGLLEELNTHLIKLDHAHLNIFIPESHLAFNHPIIHSGINHVFQIGHKVWKVEELLDRWDAACRPQLHSDSSLASPATRIGATCSALIIPDRVPWFLLDDVIHDETSRA
ncbi:hypothetical protein PPUJ20066_23640 [Pseudomonas putida]|nr:hypothetical protein PPUJ20066_23640 [Pseudomonas putida]